MRAWPTLDLPKVESGELPPLRLFSSYAKETVLITSTNFTMYVCGITPYDATHLGHAATYLTFDLIHRYQRMAGSKVRFVENITDIDDPLLERALRDHVDWHQLAEKEIELFRSDMTALRILPPDSYIGAIEAIPQVLEAISILDSRGMTYSIDGDIYLDLNKIRNSIADLPIPEGQAIEIFRQRGGDPDRAGKRHPLDTLLWLKQRPNEPSWNSKYGEGRPGWHIECTAIALTYLLGSLTSRTDEPTAITLQGGGSDLLFPHHYMSAIQVKALREQDFASVYVHSGMIGLNGEKMSKSKGNLRFVHQLLADGIDPMTVRIALLQGHYQLDRMWEDELLNDAENLRKDLQTILARSLCASTVELRSVIVNALADNLQTPLIFSAIREWINQHAHESGEESSGVFARFLDAFLGITF